MRSLLGDLLFGAVLGVLLMTAIILRSPPETHVSVSSPSTTIERNQP